jgi:hypothetical protein
MGLFIFIIVAIVLTSIVAPLAKGAGERISRGGPQPGDLQRLRAELEATEQRLLEAERRLELAEERLDFQEKLLSGRSSSSGT